MRERPYFVPSRACLPRARFAKCPMAFSERGEIAPEVSTMSGLTRAREGVSVLPALSANQAAPFRVVERAVALAALELEYKIG